MNIDFTNDKVNTWRMYGGANGSKIGIIHNGKDYMLKFSPKAILNDVISYANSCYSEFIGSQVFNSLGFDSQETLIGTYKNKNVVACKDFVENGWVLKEFSTLKNTIIDSPANGMGTELNDILFTIKDQKIIDESILIKFFWDMFIVDALLGNFDRHNGNWGFLMNESLKLAKIAPIYDCGSCLNAQADIEMMKKLMSNNDMLIDKVYSTKSSIRNNDKRINYFQFLSTTNNVDCINSLLDITNRIDFDKIDNIIDEIEMAPIVQRDFYKFIIRKRKELILDYAIEHNPNINIVK